MAEINPLYPIKELTQEQYDALGVKDANTLYAIPFDGVPPSHQMPAPGSTLPCVLITQADYDSLGTYDGNTLYCIGHPEPSYDEKEIAVVLLDENDEPTDNVTYFKSDDHDGVVAFMGANPNNKYWVRLGSEITTVSSTGTTPYGGPTVATNLVKFTIEGSIDEIWGGEMSTYGAFAQCTALKYVDLGKSIINIPKDAFHGCTSLETVILPDTVAEIMQGAFYSCFALVELEVPSATKIGASAFAMSGLHSIKLPSNLVSITYNAFLYCQDLKTIIINKPEGSISGAPWRAPNATVVWTG